jgi:hypothetical protein
MLVAMDRIPGRPFLFLIMAIGAWTGMRYAGGAWIADPVMGTQDSNIARFESQVPPRTPVAQDPHLKQSMNRHVSGAVRTAHSDNLRTFDSPVALPWAAGGQPSGFQPFLRVAPDRKPSREIGPTPQSPAMERKAGTFLLNDSHKLAAPTSTNSNASRFSAYAYAFWRGNRGANPNALAAQPQYGGSQAGVILTWDPFGLPQNGPALLVRGSIAPNSAERDIALGMRWKPHHKLPVSLTLERRFRNDRPDRFSAYVSGGIDSAPLAGPLELDAFGQGGIVSGKDGGAFFDAQARAVAPFKRSAPTAISLGGGAWAGGQRSIARLDVGPSVSATLDVADVPIRMQLDWRFRIAGNAGPSTGPTLTFSSGF